MVLSPPLCVSCPQGLAPEASLEDSGLPHGGPALEVVQLLRSQGPWQHQVLRGASGRDSRKHGVLMVFSSLWLLCPSVDHAWSWHGSLDHRDPVNAGYAGVLAVVVTGSVVLLGFF